MDDALEARFERLRHHLRRPLAGRGNLLNENRRKHRYWDRPDFNAWDKAPAGMARADGAMLCSTTMTPTTPSATTEATKAVRITQCRVLASPTSGPDTGSLESSTESFTSWIGELSAESRSRRGGLKSRRYWSCFGSASTYLLPRCRGACADTVSKVSRVMGGGVFWGRDAWASARRAFRMKRTMRQIP